MKYVKLFESFIKEDSVSIDTNEENATLLENYVILEEGFLKQLVGYTFLLPITLANALRQLILKKIKIKKMLKNETDPKKKEQLKKELKGISYEETKVKEKIEDQKAKMKDAADKSKANASPEEKAKYKKQKAAMQKKLDQAKAELRKTQGQFNGLV